MTARVGRACLVATVPKASLIHSTRVEFGPTLLAKEVEVFPFPMSNRDFIEHINISQDPVTLVMTMIVQNLPDFIPAKKGVVRVLNSQCKWVVIPLNNKSLLVEFTLFADPAGSIPVWLVNAMSYYGPYETFKKLKIQLLKPEYQNVSLAFIKND